MSDLLEPVRGTSARPPVAMAAAPACPVRGPAAIDWRVVAQAFCVADLATGAMLGSLAFGATTPALAWSAVALTPAFLCLALHACGAYGRTATSDPPRLARLVAPLLQTLGAWLLGLSLGGRTDPADAAWLCLLLPAGLLALSLPRLAWSLRRTRNRRLVIGRALLVGPPAAVAATARALRQAPGGRFEFRGVLDVAVRPASGTVAGLPVLGRADALAEAVRRTNTDTVILALPDQDHARIARIAARVPVELLLVSPGQPPRHLASPPHMRFAAPLKRACDIGIAGTLLLALSPLLLLIAVLIRRGSPGPALFVQDRVGFNNQVFRVFKFRSMRTEAADAAADRQTARADDRVTPIGAFIRRHSLDELPQLLNVLRGDMSIVGPRPHALGTRAGGQLLEDALDTYLDRARVRPGITGWAQVNGCRGELTSLDRLERRVRYDLDYIDNWSLLLDLRILIRTAVAVFHDEHAY